MLIRIIITSLKENVRWDILYTNFGKPNLVRIKVCEVLESAIYYTINFDLLTPPYEQLKIVSVQGFKEVTDSMQLKTGKRLGFKFQADID